MKPWFGYVSLKSPCYRENYGRFLISKLVLQKSHNTCKIEKVFK